MRQSVVQSVVDVGCKSVTVAAAAAKVVGVLFVTSRRPGTCFCHMRKRKQRAKPRQDTAADDIWHVIPSGIYDERECRRVATERKSMEGGDKSQPQSPQILGLRSAAHLP